MTEPPQSKPPASAAASEGTPCDILVVDDKPENLTAVRTALEPLDYRLVEAQSGRDALRRLLQQDFALILMDVQMPTMSGLETARLIRSRERSKHVPIIFITAFGPDEAEVLEAYQLGAVDFLMKPIQPQVLRAKASVFVELERRTEQVRRQTQRANTKAPGTSTAPGAISNGERYDGIYGITTSVVRPACCHSSRKALTWFSTKPCAGSSSSTSCCSR